jgi:transcriptional regulator with XRE-family HTH domain
MPNIRSDLTFAAWLRGRRAQLGQRQEDACRAVGISRPTWVGWEKGTILPTKVADLHKLADWGDVETSDLLRITTPEVPETPAAG